MALISSKWQITLGAATLLATGDILDNEAQIARSDSVDVAPVIGADNPAVFARGNVLFQLSFTRIKIFGSDEEARAFLFTYPADFPTATTEDCVITDGTDTFTLAGAAFEQNGYTATTESEWFVARHQIVGGPLTSGAIPPSLEFILTETGDFILTEPGNKILLE